jgi:hypothetical protein
MMCSVPQLASAVPEALESFGRVSTAGAAEVSAAAAAALPALVAVQGGPWIGPVAAAAAECVGGFVLAHARRIAELGEAVAAVGAAFEAADAGGGGELDLPERWASLVVGPDGCPALVLPVWVRDSSADSDARSLTEPLAAPMQLLCEQEEQQQVVAPTTAGGVVIIEARRGGRGRRPPPPPPRERQLPIPPSQSPIWQNAERHRGPVRRNERGQLLVWDYTHGDIEVFTPNGRHLGSADPITGQLTKPPRPGRTLHD